MLFLNSLVPGRSECSFKNFIFSLASLIDIFRHYENAHRRMPQDITDDKSTLVQVMIWCLQATSHYLNLCWPRSLMLCGITRSHWVFIKFFLDYHYFILRMRLYPNLSRCSSIDCSWRAKTTLGELRWRKSRKPSHHTQRAASVNDWSCVLTSNELVRLISILWSFGPLFTKKTPSYEYRDPHDKPKTVSGL